MTVVFSKTNSGQNSITLFWIRQGSVGALVRFLLPPVCLLGSLPSLPGPLTTAPLISCPGVIRTRSEGKISPIGKQTAIQPERNIDSFLLVSFMNLA